MAAVAGPATPQRPLPGAFVATPAPPTFFATNAASLRQNPPPPPAAATPDKTTKDETTTEVKRGARTIDEILAAERRFPALEDYIQQGVSGEYELPKSAAWLPYQETKTYEVPPRLLQQSTMSDMRMSVGVFPALHHAWMALDNALYLWDYTTPNPEIIGYEDNQHLITSVKLVPPKPGVFVKEIKALVVVCSHYDMHLLGIANQTTATGAETIALYNTRMSIPVKGLGVQQIVASPKTGRIFFWGEASDDIYEFQYQQDEGWFRGKCSRVCHTITGYNFVSDNFKAVGHLFQQMPPGKKLKQLVIDDSRDLMYTLGSRSEIRVWLIKDRVEESLSRPLGSLLQNTGHFNSRTELLANCEIVAISAIPVAEARKVSLMATTNTGCRLYLSVTRGYGNEANAQNPPGSTQILHIRYPPTDPNAPASATQPTQSTTVSQYNQPLNQVDTNSRYLSGTREAYRFPPGYWMAVQPQPGNDTCDRVFCAAPDSARLKNLQDASLLQTRFGEYGQWVDAPSKIQEVMPLSTEFGAIQEPVGFGNELAVQFDRVSPEFAIITTSGVQIIRRRRLVDIFASMLKHGSSDSEGIDGELKRFVARYGRGETAATALAVACGQGLDVTESRVANITDPEVVEKAKKAFIEHGGRAEYNSNAIVGSNSTAVDNVRPSPRHEGLSLYISRLVRSIWEAPIIKDGTGNEPNFVPNIKISKLQAIQRALKSLRDFLEKNKNFIEGLAGAKQLSRVTSRQDEVALQGEHRAMNSLVLLLNSVSEGISFVLTLFDERVEEIMTLLSEDNKKRTRDLKYKSLFVSSSGRDLAKELVKAIVNRNIANGSNVDTVADALRQKCGSFCSADDVVIFKAQEQVKRAKDAGGQSEAGRVLLNESQRLFSRVAKHLDEINLTQVSKDYVEMEFYAGAIQLCLKAAAEKDKTKRAVAWIKENSPTADDRPEYFEVRKKCYDLVFEILLAVDQKTSEQPQTVDSRPTVTMVRLSEAYEIVNGSDDLVFLTCLYDWYINELHLPGRLLDIDNKFVVEYLRKRMEGSRAHADLLWRYFVHHNDFLQAASVQLIIARGQYTISLDERISYLSQARANASTRQTALTDSRQNRQQVLREVSDLLDIAQVQYELLQRIKDEPRINATVKPQYVDDLNSQIHSVETLFSQYADGGSYHDICILLYQVADYRNAADIFASWSQLVDQTHAEAPALFGRQRAPWEAVGMKVLDMGRRLQNSPATFPVHALLPLLEKYRLSVRTGQQAIPVTWTVDLFLDLEFPHETLLPVVESVYYSNEQPFLGAKKKQIGGNLVYLLSKWFYASERSGERVLFGNEENCSVVQDCLAGLLRVRDALEPDMRRTAEDLVASIRRFVG